ncbi:MAG: head GIN domain-containing protein [Bacteroidota bacterium]
MKHQFRFILIALIFLPSIACGVLSMTPVSGSGNIVTQTVNVSNFSSVILETSGDVYIEQGQTESLTVEADDNIMPVLVNGVKGNELVLGAKPGQNIDPSKKIVYRITVKDLTGVSLMGSGNFYVSPIKSDSMKMTLSGSGNINMEDLATGKLNMNLNGSGNILFAKLGATSIDTSANGSGDIQLAGRADSQSLTFSGSGNYRAGDLETKSADINIPGSADVTVWVTEQLKVHINGSGTVSYYGKPSVDQSGSGSGKMVSLGDK